MPATRSLTATWELSLRYGYRVETSVFDAVGRNYGALRQQPSPETLRAFKEFASRHFPEAVRSRTKVSEGSLIHGIPPLTLSLVLAGAAFFVMVALGVNSPGSASSAPLSLLCLIVLLASLVAAIRILRARGDHYKGWYRLYWFAQQNNFVFTPHTTNLHYPGIIFAQGHDRQFFGRVHSTPEQRYFDAGAVQYTVGYGKNETTVRWGYMVLQLDRKLPHIVLDSKQNNASIFSASMSNLPVTFRGTQKLSLEGDFDKYFTLYCPQDYERDALYVLTPDLMALLIDNASPFDVEIVDDLMFVYSQQNLTLDNEAYARRIFAIMDTVGRQTIRQTKSYADERVADSSQDTVAPQGRRLRTRWSTTSVIVVGFALLYYLWPRLVEMLHPLFFG